MPHRYPPVYARGGGSEGNWELRMGERRRGGGGLEEGGTMHVARGLNFF